MKIFFQKEHSLYKIFKTLEKIPNNKTIHIYMDPEHSFFENERWGKQIQEALDKKSINAFFITQNEKSKRFFENLNMQVIHKEQNKILKTIRTIFLFFFNIKKFHLSIYNKKNVIFYVVFFFEAIFILWILYLLYTLILPSAHIQIKSAYQIEPVIYNFRYYPHSNYNFQNESRFLSIPYYTGELSYKYDMSISVSNIKHIQNPSHGEIKIFNKTKQELPILPNSRFITPKGLLFKNNDRFTIPAGSDKNPWEITISVSAMERDDKNMFMGSRWNITKGTPLYLKNLKSSFYLKEIYAKTIQNFTGWSLNADWTISTDDIELLSGKLVDHIERYKQNIVRQNFTIKDSILLWFNNLIKTETKEITIKNKAWEKQPNIQWFIITKLHFNYIKTEDLLNAVREYLDQRPSEKVKLINIDTNSLSFFTENIKTEEQNIIIIPTKINAIQWYDFTNDINGILNDIKDNITNKETSEAKNIILSYPETAWVKVKISPFRYNQTPRLKSRIKISIE